MDVRIETIPPLRVVYFDGAGPYATECPRLWKRMSEYAARHGLHKPGAWHLTICNEDPRVTSPERIRPAACVSVDESFTPTDGARVQTIGGGLYAVATYTGPYTGLPEAWQEFTGWLLPETRHERRPDGACFEAYRNAPGQVPDSQLITDLCLPVRPRTVHPLRPFTERSHT